MWIYAVYSQGPETLHNGTPKMYVTFFTRRGGKTVVMSRDISEQCNTVLVGLFVHFWI